MEKIDGNASKFRTNRRNSLQSFLDPLMQHRLAKRLRMLFFASQEKGLQINDKFGYTLLCHDRFVCRSSIFEKDSHVQLCWNILLCVFCSNEVVGRLTFFNQLVLKHR